MDYYEENNRDGFDGYDDGYETFGEYDDSVYAAGDGGAAELEEPNGSGKHRAAGEVYDWLEAVMYALVYDIYNIYIPVQNCWSGTANR